ncbi:hypothetical protein NSERUTF1_5730 [Nocardia seriolae]|nr:hypothetical protein NSERUTF1_5730 [Nocardia seriolae]
MVGFTVRLPGLLPIHSVAALRAFHAASRSVRPVRLGLR